MDMQMASVYGSLDYIRSLFRRWIEHICLKLISQYNRATNGVVVIVFSDQSAT